MTTFVITAPDGKEYEVDGPEGSTQEQALAKVKAQVGEQQKQKPLNIQQRRMGLGKQGDTMEKIREAVDTAGYKAGGAVTDLTGSPGLGYATNVAVESIPVVLGAGASKVVASPVIQQTARDLMQSALKPNVANKAAAAKAMSALDTMFEEGVNVSRGGVEKLRSKINEVNAQIAEAIRNSPATIDKSKVGQELLGTLDRLKKQVNPQADIEAVKTAWTNFRNHPLLAGIKDIPVQLAQELKQGTYKALGGRAYGELKGADIEAQKGLARGLKNEISSAVPAVGPANAIESKLLNALSLTERRVLMDANKNPAGLSLLTHSPEAFAAFMVDRSPLFKSLIARVLHANAGTIPTAVGGSAGAIPAMQSGSPPTR